jgi:two-component system OmpR family response regulator
MRSPSACRKAWPVCAGTRRFILETTLRILAIEDEPELGRLLVVNLGKQGLAVDLAVTLGEADSFMAACAYDLVLLDLRLPDGSGLDVLRRLRGQRIEIPIIIVSAADSVEDRVIGLTGGADDYIVKPFAIEELAARIGAVLRRPGRTLGLTLATGNVTFNTVSREVEIAGVAATVPRRELAALEVLMRADGRVVTRESMEDAIYSLDDDRQSNVLESTISRLRRRLESESATIGIRVVRGVGYRIEGTAQVAAGASPT